MSRLLSAYDDFRQHTLGGVPGALAKLRFLSSLRPSGKEDYRHWGLERTYGRGPAQEAMGKAHTEAFLAELSVPLHELWKELLAAAGNEGLEVAQYARSLLDLTGKLPDELGGGSRKHHLYVLKGLALVAQIPGAATPPAASPLR